MSRCPEVCCVEEYWSSQKRLHQMSSLLHCCSAALARVRVFQQVNEGGRLFPLEEVDDGDQVEKILETGIFCSLLLASPAHTLALPRATKEIHRTMARDQVAKEEVADALD